MTPTPQSRVLSQTGDRSRTPSVRPRVGSGRRIAVLILATLTTLGVACSRVPIMRGEILGLQKLTTQADRNGAKRCAPRELALAQSHTLFATIELEQANMLRAQDHLSIARENAQAAYDLSPPAKCSKRGFIVEAPPPPAPPPPPPPPAKPGDADGDGLTDDIDKCPNKPENYQGFEDQDGCPDDPDSDGDGIADSRDDCELLAEDKDGYLDADGCPEPDNDLDGIPDAKDKCPMDPEDPDGHEDEDGCPEPDNDGDKILDVDDQCPMVPGVKDAQRPGCPKKKVLVVITAKEIKITQQIHFAFAKATIRPISYKILDAVAEALQQNPKIRLEVQGHTDNRGSARLNKRLSQRRSAAVRKYLISNGISPTRLVARGYGMDRPIVANTNARGRAINRRVQFVRTEGNK